MTEKEAKQIGARQGLRSVLTGICIAQLIMMLLMLDNGFTAALFWFVDLGYPFTILFAILVLLICGYFFGRRAGYFILVRQEKTVRVGITFALLTLFIATVLGSLPAFFLEGITNLGTNDDPFTDYIFKPLFWVMGFGLVPAILIGLWFGKKVAAQKNNAL